MKKITIQVIAVMLIILFVHAGLIKWLDYSTFKSQLSAYPLLSPFAGVIAWLFPAIEIAAAALLVFPRTRTLGLSVSLGLMTMLSGYIIYLLGSAADAPCACQALLGFSSWPTQLRFNLIFTLIALLGFLLQLLATQEEKIGRFSAAKA
ncbi:MAG TPA: MauE/DoxX family redox-associated membrane protein [Chitinophaga sp.]